MAIISQSELTSLAFCWRIERRDGAGLAITSHDRPVTNGTITFAPSPGMIPAATSRAIGLEQSRAEVSGALSAGALTDRDLHLGRWDGARVRLTAVDWASPELPSVSLASGVLGEVTCKGKEFSADLLGAAAALERPVCPQTSPECRAELGDKACRVDLAGRTVRAIVSSASGDQLVLNQALDDRYRFGRLRYLRGQCCGLETMILAVNGTAVRLRDAPKGDVAGCVVEVREGCDKRFETCGSRFANAANFRGEPHLPGNDALTRYPGA